jgi:hypothetical protein
MTKSQKGKVVDPIYKTKFLEDLNRFIQKVKLSESDSTTCEKIFSNSDSYSSEKEYLLKISSGQFINTKDRGDALENLVLSIFNKIDLLDSISLSGKQTALGQIDLQLVTVEDYIYDIWGMSCDKPNANYMIGECKNYTDPVGRPEIERICWRAIKGCCLSFFIATNYTQDAIDEIGYFNLNRNKILCNHSGVYIIPLSLSMIEAVVENDINFCYFLKWAIKHSKMMSISAYLKLS